MESGSMSARVLQAVDGDVELAGLLVEFEVDELAGVAHPGDVLEAGEIDADEPAVGLVGFEGAGFQRHVDHADVGRVDGTDLDPVLVKVDLALVHQHAHRVESRLERIRAHDSIEHLEAGYAPIR